MNYKVFTRIIKALVNKNIAEPYYNKVPWDREMSLLYPNLFNISGL